MFMQSLDALVSNAKRIFAPNPANPYPRYKVYDRSYDEVVRPSDLVDPPILEERAQLFHSLCPVSDFEPLRERLAALPIPKVPTAVTILIDNSGSMKGYKIAHSIGAAGIISMYLDRMGIANEILGFTTTSWKGGEPYRQYKEAGRPRNPGRLNSLRHIVYKQAGERLEDVRSNLALMFCDGILKENVDGEAVLWAVRRLRAQKVKKRILLVISDSAPVDDATDSANDNPEPLCLYLDNRRKFNPDHRRKSILYRHLIKVVSDVRRAGDIQIDAIGMDHDVSEFYGVGDKISLMEDLAPVAIRKLESLLS